MATRARQSAATEDPGDASGDATVQPDAERLIGARVKDLRRARGMTMAALAARTGLSSGGMSQIESGTIQPSLTTLRRIAAALDEPIFRFFVEPVGEPRVLVRAAERRLVMIPGTAAHYELMTPNFRGDLEVMEMRIEPGGVSADVPLGHRGEECLVVLAGKARVQIGETTYDLSRGDAVTFRAEIPHRTTNLGTKTLVMLSAMTPPSF